MHIENPHAARVTKSTHRTVFRNFADRNFNDKNQFRVYIYTFLSDSTPKQHEIENLKKMVKTSQNHIYIRNFDFL